MPAATHRFRFVDDWRTAPMAYWVHTPVGDAPAPPAPQAVPHRGFPLLEVFLGAHTLQFSSPAQLAHCIAVLATRPLPTTRRLCAGRGVPVGPNGHWLSRLPPALKSPRGRAAVVDALRAVQAQTVLAADGASFRVPPSP